MKCRFILEDMQEISGCSIPIRCEETLHPGWRRNIQGNMPYRKGFYVVLLAVLLPAASVAIVGCTVFPEQKSPSLAMTTSAEQTERIFWELVHKQQWTKLEPLLAANVVWTLPGKTLSREQIVPYLQDLPATDYIINNVTVKPNGPDMTVTYTLQTQAGDATRNAVVATVWQQVKSGYIMTVHSEQPQP